MYEANSTKGRQTLLLEQELSELEATLDEQYYQLGREVYEAAERGVGEINRLVDRMVEIKVKLSALCGTAVCPLCQTLNELQNTYCRSCGAKMPQLPVDDESEG